MRLCLGDMARILQAPRNVWCETSVDAFGLLVDGSDYYRAFYQAAQEAERYILMTGWQFDTDACLLRGEEARDAKLPVKLLPFLDALCQRNENLRLYLLAWDFHHVFALAARVTFQLDDQRAASVHFR
jgi:phospholipase D1/2